MNVSRRPAILPITPDTAVFSTRVTYAAPEGQTILQEYAELTASDTFGRTYLRRSGNNGTTWSEPELTSEPECTAEGGTIRRGEFYLMLDAGRNRVLRFSNRSLYPDPKHYTHDVARSTRICIEVSEDEGKTFSESRQLIVTGYSAEEWAPDVCYGKNSACISSTHPFIDRAGRIVLPAQWFPILPPDHRAWVPFPIESLCFIGETDAEGTLSWSAGERLVVDASFSTRGLCEPTVSEISGGRMLMICRGSNAGAPVMPGRKWMALSSDGGLHWSQVMPLGYDTGELFYSPATCSRFIRSSRNGILYWIGNIVPENPDGNGPRYPLVIAEVNEEKIALRKETVFTIDTRHPEETHRVQLSNFHVYEDRMTGELVLHLARIFEHSETSLASPAYEYRIGL